MARPKTQSKGSAKRKATAVTQRQVVGSKAASKKKGAPTKRATSAKGPAKAKARVGRAAPPTKRAKAAGKAKQGAGKAPMKKAPMKKAPGKKAPGKKAPGKKAPMKKAPMKKAPVKAPSQARAKAGQVQAPPKGASKLKAVAKEQGSAKAKASPKVATKAAPKGSSKPAGKAKAVGKATSSEQRTLPAIELAPPPRRGKLIRADGDQADASKVASAASGKRRGQAAAKSSKRAVREEAKPPIPRRKATRKRPPAPQQLELPVLSSPFENVRGSDEPRSAVEAPPEFAPFALVETSPGNHSLLLTEFGPSTEVFANYGVEAGGYAWDSVARHLLEERAAHLRGRLRFDPESSMFCAYGQDAAALTELGALLAALFHAPDALSSLIKSLGPDAFLD